MLPWILFSATCAIMTILAFHLLGVEKRAAAIWQEQADAWRNRWADSDMRVRYLETKLIELAWDRITEPFPGEKGR